MALTNYTELQASVTSWLDRNDLSTQVVDFIALAESSIGTDVRLREQITVSTLTTVVDQDYITLPADWLEFKHLSFDGEPLEYLAPNSVRDMRHDNISGLLRDRFRYYSIEGDRLLLGTTPDSAQTIAIAYYARIPALSTTPTNFLLTKFPQVYMCKALAWAYTFIQEPESVARWEGMYQAAVMAANGSDKAALASGSPLRVRTRSHGR